MLARGQWRFYLGIPNPKNVMQEFHSRIHTVSWKSQSPNKKITAPFAEKIRPSAKVQIGDKRPKHVEERVNLKL